MAFALGKPLQIRAAIFLLMFVAFCGPHFFRGIDSSMKFHDNLDDYHPYFVMLAADLREFGISFWNRHIVTGAPYATLMASPYHPAILVYLLLPPFAAFWSTLFLVLLIGYAGYTKLLEERFGCEPWRAAIGGALYVGLVLQWAESNSHAAGSSVMLPWIVLLFERYRSGHRPSLYWSALAVGGALYLSDPSFLPLVLLAHGVYLLSLGVPPIRMSHLAAVVAVYVVGFTLYLPLALPLFQDLPHAARVALPDADYGVRVFGQFLYESFFTMFPAIGVGYVAALAGIHSITGPRRWLTLALFAVPPLVLGDFGVQRWMGAYVPALAELNLLRSFWGFYFFPPLMLVLLSKDRPALRGPRALGVVAAGAVLAWLLLGEAQSIASEAASLWVTAAGRVNWIWVRALFSIAACAAAVAVLWAVPQRHAAALLLLVLVMTEQLVAIRNNWSRAPMRYSQNLLLRAEPLRSLAGSPDAGLYRTAMFAANDPSVSGEFMVPNFHGLINAGGRTNAVSARLRDFFVEAYAPYQGVRDMYTKVGLQVFYFELGSIDMNFVSLLGARHLISIRGPQGVEYLKRPETQLVSSADPRGLNIYRNPAAIPKAFVSSDYAVLPDRASMYRAVREHLGSDVKPAVDDRVFLDQQDVAGVFLPPVASGTSGTARVTEYTPDRVVLEVSASRDAILTLTDAWHEDWHVEVNGAERPVFPVWSLYRGVTLGPGENQRVVFEYRPARLYRGLTIGGAALLLLAAAYFLDRRRGRAAATAAA